MKFEQPLELDATCSDIECKNRKDIYKIEDMRCWNCDSGPFTGVFTKGHQKRTLTCAVCGCTDVR